MVDRDVNEFVLERERERERFNDGGVSL